MFSRGLVYENIFEIEAFFINKPYVLSDLDLSNMTLNYLCHSHNDQYLSNIFIYESYPVLDFKEFHLKFCLPVKPSNTAHLKLPGFFMSAWIVGNAGWPPMANISVPNAMENG